MHKDRAAFARHNGRVVVADDHDEIVEPVRAPQLLRARRIGQAHEPIVPRIRRRIDLVRHVPAFLALWDAEAAFLAEHSPTKWLVAACDTFFDHGPAARRGPALCLSVFISTLQLAESERRTLADVAVSPANS